MGDTNNNNSKMSNLAKNQDPEEHQICKQLGHNELANRKNGFALTKKYLHEKSRSQEETTSSKTHDNLEKIWKGLFYMMWHSDKLTVQDKLAKEMSFSAFLLTMSREWQGLDRYRVSKFLRLVRFI